MDRFKIKAILTGVSFLLFGMGLNFTTSFAQDQTSREAEGARLLHGRLGKWCPRFYGCWASCPNASAVVSNPPRHCIPRI